MGAFRGSKKIPLRVMPLRAACEKVAGILTESLGMAKNVSDAMRGMLAERDAVTKTIERDVHLA
jgi:hypothetical protein